MALRGCEVCGKGYEAVRASSRFCSPKCKQKAYRNAKTSNTPSVTLKPVTVTPDCHAKPVPLHCSIPSIIPATVRPTPDLSRDPDRPMLSQSQLNYIKMRKEQG
ncbi:MAG: hypothetical protein ACYS8I_10710 [Planctomycetota bacterium]|jgi:hypothetical protein